MTPQKERIAQAKHHEDEAAFVRRSRRRMIERGIVSRSLGLYSAEKLRRFMRYCERTARQNRRAHRRNAS